MSMAMQEPKVCLGCEEPKPVEEFYRNGTGKPVARCKVCMRGYQRHRYEERSNTRAVSEENRAFFELGVLKGEKRVKDLEIALNVMEKANRALLQVITEADLRDARRRKVPA